MRCHVCGYEAHAFIDTNLSTKANAITKSIDVKLSVGGRGSGSMICVKCAGYELKELAELILKGRTS